MKMKLFLVAITMVFSMAAISCGGNTKKATDTTEPTTRAEQCDSTQNCCKSDSTACCEGKKEVCQSDSTKTCCQEEKAAE